MSRIAYFRCSSADSSVESQRTTLGGDFDREFQDEGVSGLVVAANRPGFAAMLAYVREGDTLFVTAIDRLGRDSIDIQTTYRDHLKAKGVKLYVAGLGLIEGEMGEFFLVMLAQMAQMERNRIVARTQAGRDTARAALVATGKTHKGKTKLGGQDYLHDPESVRFWRSLNNASIKATAEKFGISRATVKRYCAPNAPYPHPESR